MSDNPIKRSDVAQPSDVARFLEVSEDSLTEIQKEQKRLLRLHNSRARLNRDDIQRARGVELELHHKKTGNKDGLAEALAMQGRFTEAATTAKSKELRASLREKRDAVKKSDGDCKCDTYQDANGTLLPNQFVESYGYSEKHKSSVPFIRCQVCGKLNARPILPHLAEQKEARRKSEKGEIITDFFKNAEPNR